MDYTMRGMLNSAASAASEIGDKAKAAYRGLRMPGVGPAVGEPLPTIEPAMAEPAPSMRAPANPNFASGASPEATAFRAAGGGAASPPAAPGNAGGTLSRIANMDVGGVGQKVVNAAGKMAPTLRVAGALALPATAGMSAIQSGNTGTEDYAGRMGGTAGESFAGDLGMRTAGVLSDFGNALTFGGADRLGNLLAGNGFTRSGGAPAAPGAPGSPVAGGPSLAALPADVTEFNNTMKARGANDVAMTVGPNGLRTIGNTAPGNPNVNPTGFTGMDPRSQQLRAAEAGYARDERERQMLAAMQPTTMRNPNDVSVGSVGSGIGMQAPTRDPIEAAMRNGSAAAMAAYQQQQEAAQRDATTQRGNAMSAATSMRGQDMQAQTQQQQTAASQATAQASAIRDQANKDREFAQTQGQNEQSNRNARETAITKKLEELNTVQGPDGKPMVNSAQVAAQRAAMERGASTLGAKGLHELSQTDETRLLAATKLMAKVQAEATNWPVPWKPDYLKTMDPTDLIGLTRTEGGDLKTRNGDIIPKRFLEKEGSDFIFGKPTNEYSILVAGKK